MSEDTTQELPSDLLRLILARLDRMDQRLDRMDQRFDQVGERLDTMDRRFDRVDQRLDKMEQRFDQRLDSVDQRLDSVDQRLENLEARGYDTKPIWERALAELLDLSKRMDSLDRRFHVLTDDVIQNRADFRKYDQRLADLEQVPRA